MCAKVIVEAGIIEVVYENEGEENENYKSSRLTLNTRLGSYNIR